ncbi:protein Atossa isoform X2 [Episyrphus balteatus]|uniref:protein Atossa isoform X2 n=1 Tax=Episyrphus balteatus TaxID=286459 RepID=UPI002484DF22|nr:protein Atossa isoform X2 [Episyrphus balteatus]
MDLSSWSTCSTSLTSTATATPTSTTSPTPSARMIPTTASNTPTSQTTSAVVIGIGSLVLEGRALSEDEFAIPLGLAKTLAARRRSQVAAMTTASQHQDTPRSSHVVNITMNPNAMSMPLMSARTNSMQPDTIQQRWTQKICQLRQSSPTVSREMALEAAAIAVGVDDDQSSDMDRRMTLVYHHRPVPSPIAEKLHTLQSLATTCLRASPDNTPNYGYTMLASSPTSPLVPAAATTSPKYTSYFTSPPRLANPFALNSSSSPASSTSSSSATSNSCCSGDGSPNGCNSSNNSELPSSSSSTNKKQQSGGGGGGCSGGSNSSSSNGCSSTSPKQGPHCDQFLRKLGLAKGEAADAEDHICDISYGIKICIRWRTYCQEMEAIMARGEPICIEVYLGPATQKILLEQWIIAQKERTPGPTMTLPSLCSAIRSQLYFSQIYAWCDLIKKSDQAVFDTGRILFPSKAGISAGNGNGNGNGGSSSSPSGGQRPRLNIFYRIKTYDSTASFNSKPNVHNFPNVVISEGTCLSVCVKSLPRIHSGIPRVGECSAAAVAATAPVAGIGALFSVTPINSSNNSNVCGGGGGECNNEKSTKVVRRASMSQLPSTSVTSTNSISSHDESMDKNKHSNCSMYDEDEGSSDATLSHRERQLMKYKKRMLKRDKKTCKPFGSENGGCQPMKQDSSQESTKYQHMQLDEKIHGVHVDESFAADVPNNGQQQTLPEYGSINSIRPPLYRPSPPSSLAESVQTQIVEMISTGTQTANFYQSAAYPSCDLCGNEMSIVCMNCDENFAEITPMNKADLLLQAIQRTPKVARNRNNNNSPAMVHQAARSSNISDCQVCKRQKTQHHFRGGKDVDMEAQHQNNNNNCSNGNKNGICANGDGPPCDCGMTAFRMEEDGGENQQLGWNPVKNHNTAIKEDTSPPPPIFISNFGNGGGDQSIPHFKTPTSQATTTNGVGANSAQSSAKPNLLQLLNGGGGDSKKMRNLPKVNLTQIFCSSANSSSSPIPISCCPSSPEVSTFTFDVNGGGAMTTTTTINLPSPEASIRVQKSYSAPTLPNSPSLSPRFAKQAAFYKRRSRHLSDRSDRSSLGSDEQFSDEELEAGVYSPASSPIKFRSRISAFGRRALLGNLEESLLQRRFAPKMEVAGFRVLLGASGAFCPTQLTIPAAAYFYELRGEALSTPYVCEIRLSRKGYLIPSTGTVQATLLNPMGTVVRMFVIPYDFRDMPPWHQTFIRQRILAEESSSVQQQQDGERPNEVSGCRGAAMSMMSRMHGGSSLGHMISSENMKRLRYSIHLRFQTSRSGRLTLHTDIRLLISRRTDCDTAAAHAKGVLEAPNDLTTDTVMPNHPKYSARQENPNKI